MDLIFASTNKGKADEIQRVMSANVKILSLPDVGITKAIEEPFETFKENAYAKAAYVHARTGKSVFSEDSGLIVPALSGAPGVHSARYAGEPRSDQANNKKLLDSLQGIEDRFAYHQTIICLILNNETFYFEGRCEGTILDEPKGTGGFGYDPLFQPSGLTKSFAEITIDEKNKLSHRGKATSQLIAFLNRQL